MRRLGIAFVLGAAAFACTLIDPLDDITGGVRDAGSGGRDTGRSHPDESDTGVIADPSVESGIPSPPPDATAMTDDAGPEYQCVSALSEAEPNDTNPNANQLQEGTTCGVLGPSDQDIFYVDLQTSGTLQIELTSFENLRVGVMNGSSSVSQAAGSQISLGVTAGTPCRITVSRGGSTRANITYGLRRSGP